MRAFTSTSTCIKHACSQRCVSWSPSAVAVPTRQPHQQPQPQEQHRRQQQWSLRAASEDEQPPAIATPAQQNQASTSKQRNSRLDSVTNSLGSQKSFVSEEEWRVMDKKVNKYPSQRVFTAIGTGGDDFKATMTQAVAAVVGTVHLECVSERPSSGGKYVSVRIGPVWVETADQVIQVFSNMRKDERLKWYM